MVFMCKKCKKAFRKDMREYEEADEYCPHCDNQYVSSSQAIMTDVQVLEAKTPKAMLGVEGEDARVDARMIKDDREKEREGRSLFTRDDTDRLG